MAYVYSKVDDLEGTEKVGTKQCVALVQYYTNVPSTSKWTEGGVVMGDTSIARGTVIATFVDGKYKSMATGNHAAFYLSQDATGIRVMDQWANDIAKPTVSSRLLRRMGKKKDGSFVDPSNNADAYSVVEGP